MRISSRAWLLAAGGLLVLLSAVGLPWADDEGMDAQHVDRPGWAVYTRGVYDEAERIWMQDLEAAERRHDNLAAAKALYNLSHVYERREEFAKAIEALVESIELYGPGHPAAFNVTQRLAALYHRIGRDSDTEQQLLKLADRFDGDSDGDRQMRGEMLFQLATFYHETDRDARAEATHLQALETVRQPTPTMERHLTALVQLYQSQGRYTEAADACGRHVSVLEHFADQEELLSALSACARLLDLAGRTQEAKEARTRASEIRSSSSPR